ncbi:MAG: hypothetical protein FWC28_03035 [Proteobacteria bacterium]|nr:hypothetical protein [Cystobacterineae bacterium]MCL2259443.1 hypothetical protein [Cystobacterineae bacterium]MCL2314213.1 hypothetical protein [Pseudomonadota bacterium]
MKKEWESHLQNFWKQAGKELKRVGIDFKEEVQSFLKGMKPNNQEDFKEGLLTLAEWIKARGNETIGIVQKYADELESLGKAKKKGACGCKRAAQGQATWGEPVEKMSPSPAEKTAKVKAKKKPSAPSAKKAKAATPKPKKTPTAAKAPKATKPKPSKS